MKVPDAVPSRFGSASIDGACSTVNRGLKPGRRLASGWMNMLRANRLCQACSVTTRTGSW